MATQAYYTWVKAGKPWKLARPIAEFQAWAKANGFTVLGTIGNDAHLTDDFPEDHTPFSYTAHPVPLPGYIVCAIDIADARGLGEAMLRGARARRFPWLKYLNVGGMHYDYRDGFKAGKPNSDRHDHFSILTTWIEKSIGPFDPFGDSDMTPGEAQQLKDIWFAMFAADAPGRPAASIAGRIAIMGQQVAAQNAVIEQLAKVIRDGGGSVDTAAILRGVDERLAAQRAQVEADTRDAVADALEGGAPAVRADAAE